uniref:CSON003066 protein n=1 Tax=Culicoides sonorensis TaxID=179676 RepID=A0A336MMH7_CULSO
MQAVRGKLKASLEEAQRESEESEVSEEEIVERPKKRIKTDKSKKLMPPPTIHQSYVMKLFDRSVDLAKFEERTPLYPICRAWMKNMKGKKEVVDDDDDEILPRRKMTGVLTMITNGIAAEVRTLPPPDPEIDVPRNPGKIPAQEKTSKFNIDLNYKLTDPTLPARDDLLYLNLKRWREVRDLWQNNNEEYSKRYQDSYDILDGLYNQSQGKIPSNA